MIAIGEVRTRLRREPLRAPFVTALRTVTEVEAVVVEVRDRDGRTGIGEAVATGPITGELAGGIAAALDGPLRSAVLGRDAEDFEDLLRAVGAAVVANRSAKAAMDIALHDLRAQALGLPLHRLVHDVDPAWWLAGSPLRYEAGTLQLPNEVGLSGCR